VDVRDFTESSDLAASVALASRALFVDQVIQGRQRELDDRGLYGVGLANIDGREAALFLVNSTLASAVPTSVANLGTLRPRIETALGPSSGSFSVSEALALGVSPPQPQYGPADSVACLSSRVRTTGTFGARVRGTPQSSGFLPPGQLGILTAGHVALAAHAQAFDRGRPVGMVTHVLLPALHSPLPALDVAVIQTGAATPPANPLGIISSAQITSATIAAAQIENIAAQARGRVPASSGVHAFAPMVWFPGLGLWSDLYITMQQISDPGDSGGPVVLQGTSTIVGHIVGASPGFCSYVQEIGAQLQTLQCDLY